MHSMLHTFMKNDAFSASDTQIWTQMAWPKTEETSAGGRPPSLTSPLRCRRHPPQSLSAGSVSEDRETGLNLRRSKKRDGPPIAVPLSQLSV